MSATLAVEAAIYAVLIADATLAALATGGIHNDIPEAQAFPHVLIGHASETPAHTFGGPSMGIGWTNVIRVHVYSRYQGDAEALQIHKRIVALLNFQPMTVAGYSTADCECESMRMMVQDLRKVETRHLVSEFRVVVRQ